MKSGKKIGLSLSGGGYRAAAFHLGTLRKLNELNLLENVDVISTISGGSIAGAYYMLNRRSFSEFERAFTICLKTSVINKILTSLHMVVLYLLVLLVLIVTYFLARGHYPLLFVMCVLFFLLLAIVIFQFQILPFSALKRKAYQSVFFGDATLNDLPDTPLLAINATNLETGTLWTFSKAKVSDSSYAYPRDKGKAVLFKSEEIPVSLAVASSTNVPFPFNPVTIPEEYFVNTDDFKRVSPQLMDGGLYDNQGIHKIVQQGSSYCCDIIICSDGSQPFTFSFRANNSFKVLYRANDIMMRKVKSMQFIRDVYGGKFEIAYFSLDWEYERCLVSFVDLLIQGKLNSNILDHHSIEIPAIDSKQHLKAHLTQVVKAKIGYDNIVSKGLTPDEVKAASKIATGLSAFSDEQIRLLSSHAAVLTELQIRLYCPTLIQEESASRNY